MELDCNAERSYLLSLTLRVRTPYRLLCVYMCYTLMLRKRLEFEVNGSNVYKTSSYDLITYMHIVLTIRERASQ